MSLSKQAKFFLRGEGRRLEPLARVGKEGVSAELVSSLRQLLEAHELVKLRFVAHKEERRAMSREIAEQAGAELVDVIGHVAVLYRAAQKPKPGALSEQIAALE